METTQEQTKNAEDQPATDTPEATATKTGNTSSLYPQVHNEADIEEVIKRNAWLTQNYNDLSKKVDALTKQTSESLTQALVQAIHKLTDDLPGRQNNQPTDNLKKRLEVLRTNYPNTLI
ncbi:hypothetical protein J2I47_21140 [Fibrella sp. HMF5335]|uniref:Uncharacterized protein n=1 Tax=Fibrella rubiginis TaxID=2817060 RepID=A0A939GJQ7_9BACT|nr:hypothetical protein [Fibrella rubiginis]MBO0939073.1 hypothetical protein [Fibrella rubiginis]